MSRLIKKSLPIPQGTTLTPSAGFLAVKGAKGELKVPVPQGVEVKIEGTELWVTSVAGAASANAGALAGTTWALAKNAIEGATNGFEKILEIEGVGYRAQMEGKTLVLFLGYAQPVKLSLDPGVAVAVEKNIIKIAGIDKDLVGRVAAEIRALKKPEPYKGKGIHYRGEVIRRKVGKKAGAGAAA